MCGRSCGTFFGCVLNLSGTLAENGGTRPLLSGKLAGLQRIMGQKGKVLGKEDFQMIFAVVGGGMILACAGFVWYIIKG